jgi:hypothetical protein
MQPEAHRAIVRAAVARLDHRIARHLPMLLRGNDDEDVHVVPFLGWRLQAVGLSHTHRPGGRFGELLAPSAKTRCIALVNEAQRRATRDPLAAAHRFGRACHLLVDIAVPARSRGVWHFYGDPLEAWVEAHVADLPAMAPAEIPSTSDPEALCESLARLSSTFPADTTRSTWGDLRMRVLARGVRVSEDDARLQASVLVPAAIAHVAALLRQLQ